MSKPTPRAHYRGSNDELAEIKVRHNGELKSVSEAFVRHNGTLERVWPPADPDVLAVDSFARGSFADGWNNTGDWSITEDETAIDGYTAYRSGDNAIWADEQSFDRTPSQNGWWFCWRVFNAGTDDDHVFEFNIDSVPSSESNAFVLDWSRDRIVVYEQSNNTWRSIETVSATLPANEWLDCVGRWRDGQLEIDVYDSGGELVASAAASATTENGEAWLLYSSARSTDVRVDDIRFRKTHPYTDINYDEPPREIGTGDDGGDPADADAHYSLERDPSDFSSYTGSNNVSYVRGADLDRDVMEVTVNDGDHYGMHQDLYPGTYQQVHIRFWLYFPSDWVTNNTELKTIGAMHKHDKPWSVRTVFFGSSTLEPIQPAMYTYHESTNTYGSTDYWSTTVERGEWHQFDMYVDHVENEIKGWHNETLCFDNPKNRVLSSSYPYENTQMLAYHGGTPTANTTFTTQYRDISFWFDKGPQL